MATQYQYHAIGSTRTYHSTKPIARKPLMAVWVHLLDPLVEPELSWVQIPNTQYDLINQSAVIHSEFELDQLIYDTLELRVADTEDELTQVPSDLAVVVGIADEIIIVADIADEVVIVATEPLRSAIEIVGTDPLKQAILDVTTEPLKAAILNAESNAQRAEDGADASAQSAVESAQSASESAQSAIDATTNGQLEVWKAEAEAMTSDSHATEFIDGGGTDAEWVKQYTSNGDGTFTAVGITNTFSSYYWSTKANLGSSGLNFQDVWDMSGGAYPTTRPSGDPLETGDYFIVNVNGQTPDLVNWFVGDYAIVTTDAPLTWGRYPNVVDWNAVTNIPENVYNALSRSGGTMTGTPILNNTILLKGLNLLGELKSLIGINSSDQLRIGDISLVSYFNGSDYIFENEIPQVRVPQGTDPKELTRKDYVDAAISALNPIGSVALRMDAINPATIYGGTWALITGNASLKFGDGTVRDGVVVGADSQAVPLLAHSHANTASSSSSFTGSALAGHSHTTYTTQSLGTAMGYTWANTANTALETESVSAGTPEGSVSTTTTMTNASAGDSAPVIDTSGAGIAINVWRRLS